MASYLVRFVANLDPNVGESTDLYWPQYDTTTNQTMLELLDGSVTQALTTDTYRAEAMAYLTNVMQRRSRVESHFDNASSTVPTNWVSTVAGKMASYLVRFVEN